SGIFFAAMLRCGPHAGALVALLGCLSSCVYPRRQHVKQLTFNLSLTMVQSWLAGLTFYYLNGRSLSIDPVHSLAATVAAAVVFFGINSLGVTGIIAL